MKCAIFCLLASCTFQVIFAEELPQDPPNLRHISMDEIFYVRYRLDSFLWTALRAVEKGVSEDVYTCRRYFEDFEIRSAYSKCDECFNKAKRNKNLKLGRICCRKITLALEKQAKSIRANTMECIAKYSNEAAASVQAKKS